MVIQVCNEKGRVVESGEINHLLNHPTSLYSDLISEPSGNPVTIEKSKLLAEHGDLQVSSLEKPLFGRWHFFHALNKVKFELHEGETPKKWRKWFWQINLSLSGSQINPCQRHC